MQIILNTQELEKAVLHFISLKGLSTCHNEVAISFINGRQGTSAEINLSPKPITEDPLNDEIPFATPHRNCTKSTHSTVDSKTKTHSEDTPAKEQEEAIKEVINTSKALFE